MSSRVKAVQECLSLKKDTALFITSRQNRFYVSGFSSSDGYALILPGAAYYYVDFRYIEAARSAISDLEVMEWRTGLFQEMLGLLKKQGIKTLLFEEEELSYAAALRFKERFKGLKFLPEDGLLAGLRREKTPFEKERIGAAQRLSEEGFRFILGEFKEGVTERQMAARLDFFLRERGGEKPSFDTIMLFGENTAKPHGVPSDRPLKKGDFILMDFGIFMNGYASDMTRTVAFHEPSDKMRAVYEVVKEAQTAALCGLRSGMTGKEGDALSRDVIAAAGYGDFFGHSLGHGVGIDVHEEPRLASTADEVLRPGNVVSVEPGIYLSGEFGVRIEDLVLIEKDGIRNLNSLGNELVILNS